METVDIKYLEVEKKLDCYICHKSGEIMHSPGDTLTLANLTLMEECGINSIILLGNSEDPSNFQREAQKKAIKIEDIAYGEVCPITLFDTNEDVIVKEGSVIQQGTLSNLNESGVKEIYYYKDKQELQNFQYEKYKSLLESDVYESIGNIRTLEHPKEKAKREEERKKRAEELEKGQTPFDFKKLKLDKSLMFLNPSTEISATNLKEEMKNSTKMRKEVLQPSIRSIVKRITEERQDTTKKHYIERYYTWIGKVQEIFTSLKSNKLVPFETIDKLAREIVEAFVGDSYFCLNLTNMHLARTKELHIMSHCVNVCLLSIGMANVLGYNPEQTIEIAIGALLHDVGHILTFRPLLGKEKLDSSEQQKYDQHSILGLSLLKNVSSIPISTPYIIYQHHERINGSGRILHCKGKNILDYAKLIAVADVFDLTCGEKTPFSAMTIVIGMGKSQLLDMTFVKALLVSMSLFPIGSLVLVTGNYVCKVIGTNGKIFKEPVVRMLCRMKENQIFELEKVELINLASKEGMVVLKGISHPVLSKNISKGF